jgi:DNA-binding CsgD family transcriptional regulator
MAYLTDVESAWNAATPDESNKLARQLFAEAIVENRTVVAVKPRSDLFPFFLGVKWCLGGSDGLRSHARTMAAGVVLVSLPPERRVVGKSGRAAYAIERRTRLTPAEREAVCRRAVTRSLRDVAAHFGISHETVRSILRDRKVIAVP